MRVVMRIILLIPFLLLHGVAAVASNSKHIVVGYAVEEADQETRLALEKGLSSINFPDTDVVPVSLILGKNASECDVCQKLYTNSKNRIDVLIDTTEADSAFMRSFVRRSGIPTISTTHGLSGSQRAWPDLKENEIEWLVQVNTPADTISTVVPDLVSEYGIRNAVLLYDKSFGKSSEKLVRESLHNRAFRFPATLIDPSLQQEIDDKDKKSIHSVLQHVKSNNVTSVIVLAQVSTINQLLDEAVTMGLMNNEEISLYLVTKSPAKIRCPRCKSAAMLLLQPTKSTSGEYGHVVEDPKAWTGLTHENKVDSFFYYDLVRYVAHTITDLMASNQWNQRLTFAACGSSLSVDQVNERRNMTFASELAMDGFYGKYGRFHVDDHAVGGISFQDVRMRVAKIDFLRGEVYDNKMSEWNFHQTHGHFIYTEHQRLTKRSTALVPGSEPRRTVNLQKHLRIVMYLQPPFIMTRPKNGTNHGEVEYYGYCIDLMDLIRDKMKNASENRDAEPWDFTWSLYPVPDGKFGEKDLKKQTWDGIIGEIAANRADIGLGPVAVMAERETVVDFTVPYYDLIGINILMKKAAVPSHLFKFLTVLETEVWFTILAAYLLAAFLLFAYDRISPYSYRHNKEGWADEKRRDFSMKECLWFCMTSLTPQGGGEGPQSISGRLVAATWWTFGFFAIATYTANLAAFLTVSRLDSTMESLDHLSHQFRVRYATQADTEPLVYFKRMAYIEHKFYQIWKNMSLNMNLSPADRSKYSVWDYPISDKFTKILAEMYQAKMPRSYAEGVRRVLNSPSAQEGFAFVTDAVSVKFAINAHCNLHSIGNEFSRKPVALVVQQNTTLKDRLSAAILKLLNERRLETLKEFWWRKYSVKCEDTRKSSDGISIHNIGGVFIVIFAGVILACITLVIEYIMLRAKKAAMRSHVAKMQHSNNSNFNLFNAKPNALAASHAGRTFGPAAGY